ncbi:hypothetical protein BpHYR1_047728 [Brachionus plicatilis]|uniref:Uncharacterized protein n=1 Tax=Brachionus plicatilis TaxID=10195 RepID=A0A3M7P0J5_BRAPC|nr:hypothetical protein BpHYR1_047728 [Brachionus plicatilis]
MYTFMTEIIFIKFRSFDKTYFYHKHRSIVTCSKAIDYYLENHLNHLLSTFDFLPPIRPFYLPDPLHLDLHFLAPARFELVH